MKTFLEVFPDLHIAENVRGLLEMVGVEKISTNRDRSVIRVYIDSPRLMHKQSIYDLEKGIKEQLFPGKRVKIKILEKYHLSSQYTPEKLMNVYRDSILMELKNYSILLYNMFRKAEMDFEEEGYLRLSLEDTMIVRDKAPELVRILEKIFTERCNVPMVVKTSYRPVEKKNTEPEIIYMKPQAAGESGAAGGSGAAAGAAGANEAYMEPSGAEPASGGVDLPFDEGKTVLKPVGKLKAGGNPAGGRNQAGSAIAGSGKGGEFRRSGYMKKSDNPDVLFGRDFDEEARPIGLEGEVGRVVIRGKILTCELRMQRKHAFFIFGDRLYRHDRRQDLCTGRYAG
ncbi:MAG: PolC-type DNA polymerase III N-terminal domain-containing protein [Clostridium fessum]